MYWAGQPRVDPTIPYFILVASQTDIRQQDTARCQMRLPCAAVSAYLHATAAEAFDRELSARVGLRVVSVTDPVRGSQVDRNPRQIEAFSSERIHMPKPRNR